MGKKRRNLRTQLSERFSLLMENSNSVIDLISGSYKFQATIMIISSDFDHNKCTSESYQLPAMRLG